MFCIFATPPLLYEVMSQDLFPWRNLFRWIDFIEQWSSPFLFKQYLPLNSHNGCFNWMIPNLYIRNSCLTKHPLQTGCLEFQVGGSSTKSLEVKLTIKIIAPNFGWLKFPQLSPGYVKENMMKTNASTVRGPTSRRLLTPLNPTSHPT